MFVNMIFGKLMCVILTSIFIKIKNVFFAKLNLFRSLSFNKTKPSAASNPQRRWRFPHGGASESLRTALLSLGESLLYLICRSLLIGVFIVICSLLLSNY